MEKTGKILITLKSGEQKWMTKREYNNYKKRLSSLKDLYDQYVEYGFINNALSIKEKVQTIVNMGVELMGVIGTTADKITITGNIYGKKPCIIRISQKKIL